jgi:hypothetical protein
MRTVVAIFDDAVEERKAVQDLQDSGIDRDLITVMTNTAEDAPVLYEEPGYIRPPANRVDVDATSDNHKIILSELGIPEQDGLIYLEVMRHEGTLVAVNINDESVDQVSAILNSHNPLNIEETPTYGLDQKILVPSRNENIETWGRVKVYRLTSKTAIP